jgi:KDO2-lipid IV(A) lauroyltransferase
MVDRLYLALFYILKFLIFITPEHSHRSLAKILAYPLNIFGKKYLEIVRKNVEIAFGKDMTPNDKEKIVNGSFENLVLVLIDLIFNMDIKKEILISKVSFKNREVLSKAIKDNRKVVLVTAHYGTWEALSYIIGLAFKDLICIARPLDSAPMDKILFDSRSRFNTQMVNKDGAIKDIIKGLKQNKLVAMLIDHHPKKSDKSTVVDFFGKKTDFTPSSALIAKKFDAVIIPTFIHKKESNYYVEFDTPIDTKEIDSIDTIVQLQASSIEKAIRNRPREWFWFHKRWKNMGVSY